MQKRNCKTKKQNKNATNFGSFFAISANVAAKKTIALLLFLAMFLSLCGCSSSSSYSSSRVYSFGDVSLTTYNLSSEEFQSLFEEICEIADDFEDVVSLSNENSELSVLNQTTGGEISESLKTQIELALSYHEKTYGSFNILLAKAVAAWGFLPGEDNYLSEEIPTKEDLEAIKYSTDISQISISESTLEKPQDFTIDLGGISKGYMADQMKALLEEYSADGILTVGGIVIAVGDKLGKEYSVAITDPESGGYFTVLSISNATIVTSGNYERYFEVDGERYCHIIDPETLSPTTSDVASVSIISQSATDADVFATALMILDKEERESLISENNLSVLLIYQSGEYEIFGDFPAE